MIFHSYVNVYQRVQIVGCIQWLFVMSQPAVFACRATKLKEKRRRTWGERTPGLANFDRPGHPKEGTCFSSQVLRETLRINPLYFGPISDSSNLVLKPTLLHSHEVTKRLEKFGGTPSPRMGLKADSVIDCDVLCVYNGSIIQIYPSSWCVPVT